MEREVLLPPLPPGCCARSWPSWRPDRGLGGTCGPHSSGRSTERGICSPHRAQDGDLQMLGGPALRAAGGLSNGCGSEVSGKAGRAPRARKPLTPLGSGPWSLLYSRVDGPRGSSPQTDSRSCRPHGPRPAPRASLLAFRLVFLGFPREFLQSHVVPRAEVRGPEPPGPGSRPQLPTCFGEAECPGRAAA